VLDRFLLDRVQIEVNNNPLNTPTT
jgi:hypothetical protein